MVKVILLSMFFAVSARASLPEELLGTWVQPCRQKAVRTEAFTETTASLSEVYYADTQCAQELLTFKNEGDVTAGNGQMDFRFTKVSVTLLHTAFVDDYNSRSVCGFEDWQVGVEKDITGLSCALFTAKPMRTPREGDMRYGIYMIQDNRLYLGKLTYLRNALTPENRPNEFDVRYYIRQK